MLAVNSVSDFFLHKIDKDKQNTNSNDSNNVMIFHSQELFD